MGASITPIFRGSSLCYSIPVPGTTRINELKQFAPYKLPCQSSAILAEFRKSII
jgi:hypothetical protein